MFGLTCLAAGCPSSAILVYRNNDSETGCIDAFVVLRASPETIWNYFCR